MNKRAATQPRNQAANARWNPSGHNTSKLLTATELGAQSQASRAAVALCLVVDTMHRSRISTTQGKNRPT